MERGLKIAGLFQSVRVDPQALGHCAVEHYVGAGDAVRRPQHAELELVAGECEGRGAVAVGRVAVEFGKDVDAQLHLGLFGPLVRGILLDGLEHRVQLVADEHRNDCRGSLVGAETVVVAGCGDRDAEQILVVVHRLDHGAEEEQELRVLVRGVAGREQVLTRIGGYRPVVVLAAAVHAGEGLLVEQADEAVLRGHLLHYLHRQLVVVGSDVGRRIDRRELMLRGRDFVVFGLRHDAQFPELVVELLHEGGDLRFDRAEVVVVHLLALGRLRAEERPAAEAEVGS